MTSRERIKKAMNHETPDKLPVDFGATALSGISASTIFRLRQALGLKERPIKIVDCMQMLGEIDEELLQFIPTDVVSPFPRSTFWGTDYADWKEWTMFDGTPVLVPGDMNTVPDEKGNILVYPQNDRTVAPCAQMPKGGYYFDALVRQDSLDEDALNVEDNLEEFTVLDEDSLKNIQLQVDKLYTGTDKAIVGSIGGTGLGDVAFVPGLSLKHPKGVRDIEEWYYFIAAHQEYLSELFDRQTDIALKNLSLYQQAVGNKIDVIVLCGTDFGMQNGTLCSVDTFRELYLPYYKKMTEWIHKNTDWKIFKHSCGAIESMIPSFIEAGFDILNPVQCSAKGMEPSLLKEKYGDRITFWGGGVDTQKALPFGTVEEVEKQVAQRIEIFGKNGGFVFNTIHNTQAKVPVENFMAMIRTIQKYR